MLKDVLRALPRGLQRHVPRRREGVAILAYHLVGARTNSVIDIPESRFERDMQWLADSGRVVSLDALVDHRCPAQRLSVVLTFDDAYANFGEIAWPILERLQLPATLYVPTGFIEGTRPAPIENLDLPPMSWGALREISSSPLLTLGSHSDAHTDLRRLAAPELMTDLARAKTLLHKHLGVDAEHFCYPQAKWSRAAEAGVREFHRTATIAGGWHNSPTHFDPMRLRRTPVRSDVKLNIEELVGAAVNLEEWLSAVARRLRR